MKHAGAATLERLSDLLAQLRQVPGLVERKPGIFYVKSKAALHFHDDPTGVYADLRLGTADFQRMAVHSLHDEQRLLALVRAGLPARPGETLRPP